MYWWKDFLECGKKSKQQIQKENKTWFRGRTLGSIHEIKNMAMLYKQWLNTICRLLIPEGISGTDWYKTVTLTDTRQSWLWGHLSDYDAGDVHYTNKHLLKAGDNLAVISGQW